MDRATNGHDDPTGTRRRGAGGDARARRARQGVEHLQAAARELIQAARAVLDVAEELVDDPEAVASLAGMWRPSAIVARRVTGSAGLARRRRTPEAGGEHEPDGRVERITVH